MNRIASRNLRLDLADTLNRVAYGGERIVIERRGKDVAVLMPVEDAVRLEQLEDELDAKAARRILADPKQKPVRYRGVRKELGLE